MDSGINVAIKRTKLVTLVDGRQVDSASEDWRHECEARHVAKLALHVQREYLDQVGSRRGAAAGQALEATLSLVTQGGRAT